VAPGGWLDTTAWFVVDPNDLVKPLILQNRKEPELSLVDDEFAGDGGVRYFIWKARYTVAYGSWRHCFQGNS
jgi:phage major head subunit gpT-like protein